MKSCISFLAVAVLMVSATGAACAEEKKPAEQGSLGKALIDRFDTNGNGQIDPDESAAAREQLGKGRGGQGAGRGKAPGLEGKGKLNGKGKGDDGKMREALMKKFDANGNGQLEPAELEAAKAALEKMRNQQGKGKNKGKGGKADGARRETMLKKFDANGNGMLDPDEMQAAKAQMQQRRSEKAAKKSAN
jgi:hypothetical protein